MSSPSCERRPTSSGRADAEPDLIARVDAVRAQLFRLAGGLDPVMLDERGLGPALRELAEHAGIPVSVSVPDERFPPDVENASGSRARRRSPMR